MGIALSINQAFTVRTAFLTLWPFPSVLLYLHSSPRTLSDLFPGGDGMGSQFGRTTPWKASWPMRTTCQSLKLSPLTAQCLILSVSQRFQFVSGTGAWIHREGNWLFALTQDTLSLNKLSVYELWPLDNYSAVIGWLNKQNDSYLRLFPRGPEGSRAFLILLQ